jgi:hypothetical protein
LGLPDSGQGIWDESFKFRDLLSAAARAWLLRALRYGTTTKR